MTIGLRRVRLEFFSLSTTRVVDHSRFFADHRLIATWFQGSDRPSAHSLSPRHPAGLSRHGVSVQWFALEALELTYKAPSGRVANEFPYRHDEPSLQSGVLSREPQADCHRECQAAGFHPSSRLSRYNNEPANFGNVPTEGSQP